MKIAFVTDEFPTSSPSEGGLATYVSRISGLMNEAGHEVHVFVPSRNAGQHDYHGIKLHNTEVTLWLTQVIISVIGCIPWLRWKGLDRVLYHLGRAWNLSRGLSIYENEQGDFDFVQSCDLWFCGLFVQRKSGRPHLVRCSWARDAFQKVDGVWWRWDNRIAAFLERVCLRKADLAYAPSVAVANYYTNIWNIPVGVIRPPLPNLNNNYNPDIHCRLPIKYLIHYGQLLPRKGTDFVIEAMRICRMRGVEVKIVIAGVDRMRLIPENHADLGIVYLGALTRDRMSYVVYNALAAVLPSRIDNLPNTAIEAMVHNKPIITMQGSSVDEFVVDGVNGYVVGNGDIEMLAEAIIKVWNVGFQRSSETDISEASMVFKEMGVDNAICSLLSVCRPTEDVPS